jgi:hypothetical protein
MTDAKSVSSRRTETVRRHLRAPTKEVYTIPFRGQRTKLPVIRIDTRDLSYNIELGRLIIDRLTIIDVGADADPEDPKLQDEIESKILAFRETGLLKRLIARDGQLEPGVITSDGYVINGNRRLAVLRSLAKEPGNQRFAYMDVAVLPEDAKRDELYLLEASMQMTPETRARYGPVTTMLQIQRGLQELRLEKEKIAEAMNMEVEDLEKHLERLALMTEYLAFIGRPGEYHLLEEGREEEGREGRGKNQHFIEIQNLKRQHERNPSWESFLRHLFVLVSTGATYDDIRSMKTWKADGLRTYAEVVREFVPPPEKKTATSGAKTKDATAENLSSALEDLTSTLSPSSKGARALPRPTAASKEWKDVVEVAFEQTVEILDNRKRSTKPADLLKQALRKLEAVDLHDARRAARQGGREPSVQTLRNLLAKIAERVAKLRAEIKSPKR